MPGKDVYVCKTRYALQSLLGTEGMSFSRRIVVRKAYRRVNKPRRLPLAFDPPFLDKLLAFSTCMPHSFLFFIRTFGRTDHLLNSHTPVGKGVYELWDDRRRRRRRCISCEPP